MGTSRSHVSDVYSKKTCIRFRYGYGRRHVSDMGTEGDKNYIWARQQDMHHIWGRQGDIVYQIWVHHGIVCQKWVRRGDMYQICVQQKDMYQIWVWKETCIRYGYRRRQELYMGATARHAPCMGARRHVSVLGTSRSCACVPELITAARREASICAA